MVHNETAAMGAQFHEHPGNWCTAHFKRVNFMAYELGLNKAITKKKKTKQSTL